MTFAVDMRPVASPHIDLWRNGNCNSMTCLACMHTCHIIYIGIVVVGRQVKLWCSHTTVLISWKTVQLYLADVPNYRTIWVQHVQVTVMTLYIILCWCDQILVRRVTLQYLPCMNIIPKWIRGNLYHGTFNWKSGFCQTDHTDMSWM